MATVENSQTGIPELDAALRETEPDKPKRSRSAASSAQGKKPSSRSLAGRVTKAVDRIGRRVDEFDQDGVCGNVIRSRADMWGEAIADVATESEWIKKMADKAVESTVWLNLVAVAVGTVVPIVMAHRPEIIGGHRVGNEIDEELADVESAETPEDLFGYAGNQSAITPLESVPDEPNPSAISGLPPA